jgi:hypothetical protein
MQTVPDIAKTFNEFQYPAMVDLIKQIITLAVGILVLSIAFADRVVDFRNSTQTKRWIVVLTWLNLTAAIISGCFALEFMYVGGAYFRLQKDYEPKLISAANYFELSVWLFMIGLVSIVGTGIHSVLSPTNASSGPPPHI